MNTDQVVEKILADAKAEAKEILEQSSQEVSKIKSDTAKELTMLKDRAEQQAKKAAVDKKDQMMAEARMDTAKKLLQAKRDAIDTVFKRAAEIVKEMNDTDYLRLMEALITKSVETGDEQIVLAQDETRINPDFIKEVNRKLGNGYKGNLLIADGKCKGSAGFILRRGKIRTNVTVDVLLGQIRDEIETQIAGELFT